VTVRRIFSDEPETQARVAGESSAVNPFALPETRSHMAKLLMRTAPLSIHNYSVVSLIIALCAGLSTKNCKKRRAEECAFVMAVKCQYFTSFVLQSL
jgi:hypothetical protein